MYIYPIVLQNHLFINITISLKYRPTEMCCKKIATLHCQ